MIQNGKFGSNLTNPPPNPARTLQYQPNATKNLQTVSLAIMGDCDPTSTGILSKMMEWEPKMIQNGKFGSNLTNPPPNPARTLRYQPNATAGVRCRLLVQRDDCDQVSRGLLSKLGCTDEENGPQSVAAAQNGHE